MRLADLPALRARHAACGSAIGRVDLLAATLDCRYAGTGVTRAWSSTAATPTPAPT